MAHLEGRPMLRDPTAPSRISVVVKVAYTVFIAVLVPVYLGYEPYGPLNFLWFCNIALLLTMVALWRESSFVASMQLVAVLLGSVVWLADFLTRLLAGVFLVRWTHYMFREDIPLYIRGLSLYHGFLWLLLLWAVARLGYNRRAWLAQCLLCWVLLPICYFFTDPARGLNGAFGPGGPEPQKWVPPGVWLALVMIAYPLFVFLPTHLLLCRFLPERSGTAAVKR
jgi:hypothetical protein